MKHGSCAVAIAALLLGASAARAIEFALPIDCQFGKTCFIQNYVDADPGPGLSDYACGHATYDGHKGTDFRLITTGAAVRGVPVRAAAAGTVIGTRADMPDVIYTTNGAGAASRLRGRDCGNGVVIDHGGGWRTQYCHMRRASVRLAKGAVVARGAALGKVGYSGKAAFAHLHFVVRFKGSIVDPFNPRPVAGACRRAGAPKGAMTPDLWTRKARARLGYRTGRIIEAGFTGAPLKNPRSESGLAQAPRLTARSAALVFAVRTINLIAGDTIRLRISGPRGIKLDTTTAPLPRAKATYTVFVGKKRRATAWPAGVYRGSAEIHRGGKIIDQAAGVYVLK